MNRCILAVAVLAEVLPLAGCLQNSYTVDMRPVDTGLERRLDWTRPSQQAANAQADLISPDPVEVGRLSAIYGVEPTTPQPGHTAFTGTFKELMPRDIGGAGRYVTYSSDLGELHVYVERFRGNPDLLAQLEQRLRAIDALADAFLSWADARFAGAPGADAVHQFIDADLRRDAKNVLLYGWMGLDPINAGPQQSDHEQGKDAGGALEARFALYAVERGYLEPQEVPSLSYEFQSSSDFTRPALMLLQRQVERRLGAPADRTGAMLAPLDNSDAFVDELRRHLGNSPSAMRRLREWARTEHIDSDDPGDLLRAAAQAAIRFPFLTACDEIHANLSLPEKPILTNGNWNAERSRVEWSARLPFHAKDAFGQPTRCYALWAMPDKSQQRTRLGQVVLRGAPLAEYCFWYAGLPAELRRQWDGFEDTLRPGADLSERLSAFRFPGHETDQSPPTGASLLMGTIDSPHP